MNRSNFKLAWLLLRGEAGRVWVLALCLALGVGGRVAVGSFMRQVDQGLKLEARKLLGADIEITQQTPLSLQQIQDLNALLPLHSRSLTLLHFVTMAASVKTSRARLVELEAVSSDYPFYGKLKLEDVAIGNDLTLPSLYAQSELFSQLGVGPGERIKLGQQEFWAQGFVQEEPGLGATAFSLGPRVIIDQKWVANTGLADAGSRLFYSTLIALPEGANVSEVAQKIKTVWQIPQERRSFRNAMGPGSQTQVYTAQDKQAQTERFFLRLADYMQLISLLILLVTGVGVGSVVRGYVYSNLESLAILKSLGLTGQRLILILCLQIAAVTSLGCWIGALLGAGFQNLFLFFFSQWLPMPLQLHFDWGSAGWGWFLGLATAILFSLPTLWEVSVLDPSAIWRETPAELPQKKTGWIFLAAGGIVFTLLSMVESRSLRMGPLVMGVTLLASAAIYFAARRFLPLLARSRLLTASFSARHGLANLMRPGLRPYASILALGLAAFLLGVIAIYQHSLVRELDLSGSLRRAPSFFVIDIQDDQKEPFVSFLSAHNVSDYRLSPMVKARYRGIEGGEIKPVNSSTREEEENRQMQNREQNLSFRDELGEDETLIKGKWMRPESSELEVSLEEWFAKRLNAKMGQTLLFDVLGVPIRAKVTSIRKVAWNSFLPNFFILMTPSGLENAPKNWVSAMVAGPGLDRAQLQMDLIETFPNLTLFDVEAGVAKIIQMIARITWAIRFIALFALLAGTAALIGMALCGSRARRADTVLLKVLGANQGLLLKTIVVEFGSLGLISAFLGLALSVLIGWPLLVLVLDVEVVIPWIELPLLLLLLTALCAITGLLSCGAGTKAKPWEALRYNV